MSMITLASGGLDSTLVAKLAQESGIEQRLLLIDYGQRAYQRELAACTQVAAKLGLPPPSTVDLSGFGKLIHSGLTDSSLRIVDDAFTPGRNMLFLLVAAAYAHQVNAESIAIGLLHEDAAIFPDQTSDFLSEAERLIERIMGRRIRVLAPLASFHKQDVVALALEKGISGTYSCHTGDQEPCGSCIACNEYNFEET